MVQNCCQLQTLNLEELKEINSLIVAPETLFTDVISLMNQQHSSCVLIEERQQLTGIFTTRDLVNLIASDREIAGITISEVMTKQPVRVSNQEQLNIIELISLLSKYSIRHLPVVDALGKPLGVITHTTLRTALKANYLLKQQQVKEVMNAEVICSSRDHSIVQIANLMMTHQVSCVVIVETATKERIYPIGIVTERDLLQIKALGLDLHHLLLQEVMSTPLFSISADTLLWEAHKLMQQQRIRRLVITKPDRTLAGIITQSSILQALDLKNIYATWENLTELLQEKTKDLEAKIAKQKLLQQKLALTQAKLSSILAGITDIVLIVDQSGKDIEVLSMNSESTKLKIDLIDKTLKQFWQTETADTFFSQVQQVIQTQQKIDFEYNLCLEERQFWFTAQIAPMPDGNSAIWIARDITANKQAQLTLQISKNQLEQQVANRTQELSVANDQLKQEIQHRLLSERALQESQRKFYAIFNQTFQFIGLLKTDGTLIESNQTALDFVGCKLENVVGKPFWETDWWQISSVTRSKLKQAIACAAQGEFIRYEVDICGKNQQQITIDFSLKPITDENNQVVSLIAEGRDISDRIQAEEQLKESEAKFRTIFEQAEVGIAYVGLNKQLLQVNPKFSRIVGYSIEELKKLTFDRFTHPEDHASDDISIEKLLSGKNFDFSQRETLSAQKWFYSLG